MIQGCVETQCVIYFHFLAEKQTHVNKCFVYEISLVVFRWSLICTCWYVGALQKIVEVVQSLPEFPYRDTCSQLLCQLQSHLYGPECRIKHHVISYTRSEKTSNMRWVDDYKDSAFLYILYNWTWCCSNMGTKNIYIHVLFIISPFKSSVKIVLFWY